MEDLVSGVTQPVVVNIHGGGYKNGQYKLDRTNLVKRGIVAATLQASSWDNKNKFCKNDQLLQILINISRTDGSTESAFSAFHSFLSQKKNIFQTGAFKIRPVYKKIT